MIVQEPRLLAFFLRGEVVMNRIFTSAHGRNPQWYKVFRIYGGTLAGGFLPWTVVALVAWVQKPRRLSRSVFQR